MSLVPLPESIKTVLEEYLPNEQQRTFVTLTYAQSLDSRIAAKPGVQTKISHLETKTMTHYLRSKHDAIMVGIGTVLADDPKLNCRFEGGTSPVPVVLDPKAQWDYSKSQLKSICDKGEGLPPIILVDEAYDVSPETQQSLKCQNGSCVKLPLLSNRQSNWELILDQLYQLGIKSIMIEGGAKIINELLAYKSSSGSLVDSLIITVGPVFLGDEGVQVSPSSHVNLDHIKWWTGIQDSVICAKIEH